MKITNKVLLTTIAVSLIACGGGGSSSSKGSSISTTKTPTNKLTKEQEKAKAKKRADAEAKRKAQEEANKKADAAKKAKAKAEAKKVAEAEAKKREEARIREEAIAKEKAKEEAEKLIDLDSDASTSTPNFEMVTKDFKVQGVVASIDFNKKVKSSYSYASDTKESDIHSVIIGGKKIHLISTEVNNIIQKAGEEEGFNKRLLSPSKYKYSHFVILTKDKKHYYISQGDKVDNMPTTGVALYEGTIFNDSVNKKDDFHTKITFDVNFGKKTIEGHTALSIESKLKGNIKETRFQSSDKSFVGSFYGKEAAELGGVYQDDENNAVFGAIKK